VSASIPETNAMKFDKMSVPKFAAMYARDELEASDLRQTPTIIGIEARNE
jgi:hypothetical protein